MRNLSSTTGHKLRQDLICKVDNEGNFLYINKTFADLIGLNVSLCQNRSLFEFIQEDYRDKVTSYFEEKTLHTSNSSYLEIPIITCNHQEIWIGQTIEAIHVSDTFIEFMIVARDITDRVQAEEKYQDIIQNIDLGLMEVDLDDRIVYVNESFCETVGYSKDELIGHVAKEIFITEQNESYKAVIQEQNEQRVEDRSSAYEMKIVKKDGTPIWMMISGAPVKDVSGKIIGSIGIHNDITHRKRQEQERKGLIHQLETRNEELHQNQQYLKAINEFAKRLIDSIEIDDVVREITENVINKFGFTDCVIYLMDENKTHLQQVSAFGPKDNNGEVVNPITIPIGKGIVGSVALSGKPEIVNDTSMDERYILDDQIRLSELAVPIIVEDELIGVIDSENEQKDFYTQQHLETLQTIANLAATKIKNALFRESKKKADKALVESEQKMRSIVDSALDAVITINEKGIVTEWNPQSELLFKYSKEEAIGEKLSALIIPESFRESHDRGMAHFMKTGEGPVLNKRIEVPGLNKFGEEFPIELSIVPNQMKGQFFFTAFVRDITIRKKAENDMKTALEKQKELNNMKTRFVSMTSHELRTPLTTIQTNIELMEHWLNKEELQFGEKYGKNMYRINAQINRLTDLMNDILLMGKIESGNLTCTPETCNIEVLCSDVIEELGNQYEQPVELKIHGSYRDSYLDKKKYRHVLTNLVSNALKYSLGSQSPKLTISFKKECILIDIHNHGIGIPTDEQEQIFSSFYRGSNVSNIQGTGLGLAIVHEFVTMHGGSIKVKSCEEQGTTFSIEQPDSMHYFENIKTNNYENIGY